MSKSPSHPALAADVRVNAGALQMALNVLRRAGKGEVADELEKTSVREDSCEGRLHGDWQVPTTYLQRFGDAMELLCGGRRPSDSDLADWLNPALESTSLQEFAISHGPVWAQGIGLIDAARVAADQPTEGVGHEMPAEKALEQDETELIDLPVAAYDAGNGVQIVACDQRDGSVLWAVRRNGSVVLNKDGEWEDEPFPSSRDEAFLSRCRYDSPKEAHQSFKEAPST